MGKMAAKRKLKKSITFETTFTTYTATHIIGEGGAGRIFEAVDESGAIWAIKGLDYTKTTKEKVRRFSNELTFCIRNQHPNILTIHDHGFFIQDDKKLPFYVMPLYNGSLRDLLQGGIPVEKVLPYFGQMLDGVEAAHLQSVVHRDLKPENILHAADKDSLIVADFGIARFEEDELYTAVETKDSSRLANFQYAAPEQHTRGSEADHLSDIYALGLMLNEMFTGEVPYGTGYKTIASLAADYVYLDDMVAEMMLRSLQERIQSIEAIKNQLIGRRQDFITWQHISELKNTVVPVTDIDDPLIADPPRLVNVDWNAGKLMLFFQRPINDKWIWALNNMGGHTAIAGKGPENFSFSGNKATISARDSQVQAIVDYFKGWLLQANRVYERRIQQENEAEEKKKRQDIQKKIEEQEARQRVLKSVKI